MDKINVVQLIHGIHFGGAEKVVYQICTNIDKDQFHPICIVLADGFLRKKLIDAGIETHLIPMKNKLDFSVTKGIIKIAKQNRRTVIHSHTSRTNLIGRIASKSAKVKNLSTIHSPIEKDTNISLKLKPINALVEKLSRFMLDRYVTVSKNAYDQLVNSGLDKNRITHIPNGVEINFSELSNEEKGALIDEFGVRDKIIVAMIAQLRPRKGCEYFIKAIPEILEKHQDTRFLIIGNAEFVEGRDYLGDLKKLAESLNVSDAVTFTGFREDVSKLMDIMDIIVLPSLFGEGLPLTLLEAIAHKKPIVATDTEGNNEVVVDGETGFLVPPKDSKALADKISQLIDNEDLRIKMGEMGRKRVESMFSLQEMIHRYEEVYRELVSNN